jgi:hypothetical protein
MAKSELVEKLGIYGGNYLAWPIGNYIQEGLNLGNPYGAILYAAVDLISSGKDKFTNGINNLVKVGGGVFYFGRTIKNLVEFAQGDIEGLVDFPFNATMLYTSVKDADFNLVKTKDDILNSLKKK